jgi:hypothetical protein
MSSIQMEGTKVYDQTTATEPQFDVEVVSRAAACGPGAAINVVPRTISGVTLGMSKMSGSIKLRNAVADSLQVQPQVSDVDANTRAAIDDLLAGSQFADSLQRIARESVSLCD